MKIAIVCDWLVTLGGAEKVLGEMIRCFPQADIFAVIDFLGKNERNFLQNKLVQTTFIQKFPFAKTKYRSYLPFMPLAIEQLNLSQYDVIISSSHAVAKGVITGPHQIHISYVHSPMRYAWDLQHQYLQESGLEKKWAGWIAKYFLHKLRLWDSRSATGVDYFLANSQFIAKRILKTYRRRATVIYPPVDSTNFRPLHQKENFYLAASRLVPYKKIDLIVESFRFLPDQTLVVIGDGPEMSKIKKKAGPNVELLGYQSDEVLISTMQRAKGFIFAAEEDFGIIPVEAQACGTPVIAFGRGGALETVLGLHHHNPTGLFFQEQTTSAILNAIQLFETHYHRFTVPNCVTQAQQFSPKRFREQLLSFIQHCSYKNNMLSCAQSLDAPLD